MRIRGMFKVTQKIEREGDMVTVDLQPVTEEDEVPDDVKWWEYTPSGNMSLEWIRKEVANRLECGKCYYIDIIDPKEADKPQTI